MIEIMKKEALMIDIDKNYDEIKGAWNKFINNEDHDKSCIRPVIYNSWLRSRSFGVNPYLSKTELLSPAQLNTLINVNLTLIEVVRPYMENLFSIVKGSGFYLTLCDKDGYILNLLGDEEMIEKGKETSMLVTGANRSEKFAGTNAIGTSLALDVPIQIWGEEHYINVHKKYCCSAAPIKDAFGNTIGCLNITGLYAQSHTHTFGMLVSAVDGINKEIKIRNAYSEIEIVNAQRNSIIESISSGLILLNHNNRIVQMNSAALSMLKLNYSDTIGKDISDVLEVQYDSINSLLEKRIDHKETDIHVKSAKQSHMRLNISVDFVAGENGKRNGTVLTFNETKRINKLVNRISGFQSIYTFSNIIGESPAITQTLREAKKAAKTNSNVLILGESGTGKELFAQSIHNASAYAGGPFVAINCGALPKSLIESELFGYEKGSFTGANIEGKPGKFELADGGTIFLDEIGDMPTEIQSTLLRVLQTKEIVRIGGKYAKPIDVRIIAATNKNLLKEIENKQFREDLYYRLNVFTINIPPLRKRPEDITLLVGEFLREHNSQRGANYRFSNEVYSALKNYEWPGNIRELENTVERMLNISEMEEIEINILPEYILLNQNSGAGQNGSLLNGVNSVLTNKNAEAGQGSMSIELAERSLILESLKQHNGQINAAAGSLGISRRTLYRKLEKFGINQNWYRT
jgi:transcriptional regulator of acetoin/glycerol metabolism